MDDPLAAVGGAAIYIVIGLVLLLSGATAGGIVWFVMAGLGLLAVLVLRD